MCDSFLLTVTCSSLTSVIASTRQHYSNELTDDDGDDDEMMVMMHVCHGKYGQ